MPLKIILMGTGPFAVPAFDAIRQSEHEVTLVVTKPEPPVKSRKGPPPAPVRSWALQHELPIFDPLSINDDEAVERLNQFAADLLVVCDYGQILKPAALASATLGGINLHGSLLPAYRGAAPVQRALLSGDEITGISVIHMTPKLDGGPLLCTAETPIRDDETSGQLEERLSQLGVDPVMQSLELLINWDRESTIGQHQDPDKVSKAARLSKAEAQIDWTQPCRAIDLLVRGMQPWPVAYSLLKVRDNKPALRMTVLEVSRVPAADQPTSLSPGQITGGKQLQVVTADGVIQIERLCPAGKREMTGEEFMRGYQLQAGLQFESP